MVFGPLKPVNHWLFQIGNILSIISYIQIDIMYLRIMMMVTDVCFIVYGVFIIYIAIDSVIWNVLLATINIVLLIPIIKQRLPIKFTKHEMEFYQTVERFLSPFQFNLLIENGEERTFKAAGTQICLEGNSCGEIILFFRIPKHKRVVLFKEGHKMGTVNEGTWIGHAEYLNHLGIIDFDHMQEAISINSTTEKHKKISVTPKPKSFKLSKINWHITCTVENAFSEAVDAE